ncbi:hypothetical protein SOCE26_074490 [Sorangium cellulosum]|uniref:Amine oxidase domain-containing protein n=1 Tax=Sorangium cellulosum TaxID=56 RepID=A0A2L0F340_SORCE|nr:NAD(P)/FAD-dependent oxidoreductase [Sorangium cellulosum]AUX45947.1 hypothetical protein SOCE26_074490 [Sorangium cellulosum]
MKTNLLRRRFLSLLPAAGASLWLPGCEEETGQAPVGTPAKVLVLGGGLAGLTAAYELMKKGIEVKLLEAQAEVGGRVRTLRRGFDGGQYAELGAVRIPNVHNHTLGYAVELGLELIEFTPGEPLYYLKGKRFKHVEGAPWPLDVTPAEQAKGLGAMFDYAGPALGEIGSIADGTFPTAAALMKYDPITMTELFTQAGATEDWLRLMRADGGTIGDRISALAALGEFSLLGGWNKTSAIRGGNDQIPAGLALKLGDRVLLERVVKRIEHSSAGVKVYADHKGSSESFEATHLVIAIPFTLLRKVEIVPEFPADKMRAIREMGLLNAARAYVQTGTRFWEAEGLGGLNMVKTDTGVERVWDFSNIQDGPTGMLMAYLQGDNADAFAALPADQRRGELLGWIEPIFPEIKAETAAFHEHVWAEDPWAGGGWTALPPDQFWAFAVSRRVEGRVHFAGEHTSHEFGWMQGAIESGKRAVAEIAGA